MAKGGHALTLLCPAGGPPLKWLCGSFSDDPPAGWGPAAVFCPVIPFDLLFSRHTVIFGKSAGGKELSSFIFAGSFMVTNGKTFMPHRH
jgi:hypothetical protein